MRYLPIVAKMAFRNVLRYGRRSVSTFAVVFVGVASVALADAFMNGFSDRIVSEFAVSGGHLRASAPGYEARRATCPLDKLVADPGALASAAESAALEAAKGAGKADRFASVAALPLLRAACALQLGERSVNAYAAGADAVLPGDGLAPPFAAARLVEGRYPAPGERGAAVSSRVASRLGAKPGDSLVFLASDAYGSFGAIELPLVGVTAGDAGPEACLVDLASMRGLLGVESGASEVALYLVDASGVPVDPRGSAEAVAAMEAAARAAGYEAERWNSGNSPAASMLDFFDAFAYVLYAIFAIVAGAGIANSVLLSVQDRTRDFATLRAVAFSSGWVKAIVALETLIVGTAASLAAAAAVWLAIAALGPEGVRIPESTRGIAEWMPQAIAARVDPASLAAILLAGCLLPLAAAAYPLRTLGKMKIREALGYV